MPTKTKPTPAQLKAKAAALAQSSKKAATALAATRRAAATVAAAAEQARLEHETAARDAQELEEALAMADALALATEIAREEEEAAQDVEQVYPAPSANPPTVPYPQNWPEPPHQFPEPQAVDWSRPLPDNVVPHDIDKRDSNLWFWFVLIVAILIAGFFLARWLGVFASSGTLERLTSSQGEPWDSCRGSGIHRLRRLSGFLGRRPTSRRSISTGYPGVSRPSYVDRTDYIGVILVPALHAKEQRLRLPVVRRHVTASGAPLAGVVRGHGD
jgi:hypothetical protein